MNEEAIGYARWTSKIMPYPIHPLFRPVDFSENQHNPMGLGTLILDGLGRHRGIVTAAHLFKKGVNYQQLFYRVLQPFDSHSYSIARAYEVQKEDVVMCLPGPPTPITGFSNQLGVIGNQEMTTCKVNCPECILLSTGEKFPVLGHVTFTATQEQYFVIQYQCHAGESGAAFLRPESSNDLYILKGKLHLLTDEQREVFGIPVNFTHVSLAAGVTIG